MGVIVHARKACVCVCVCALVIKGGKKGESLARKILRIVQK